MYGIDRHLLSTHDVRIKSDSSPQSVLRLMQSLWRQENGLPAGSHRAKRLGSTLAMPLAKESLANFLTPGIRQLVREEVEGPKAEAKPYGVPRIYDNLLSSQPLCFNLFGELALDLDAATAVARRLWPDAVDRVTSVEFLWSPPAGEAGSLEDETAFDVVIFHTTPSGGHGFVGFMVRYHENLRVRVAPHDERYEEVAAASAAFVSKEMSSLASPPLQQMWLHHLLALSMLATDNWETGRLVFLYPSINERCADVVGDYERHLAESSGFESVEMETLLASMAVATEADWVEAFRDRYLNVDRVTAAVAPAED